MSILKKTFIIFAALYILFFVKTWGSVAGNIYSHDDVVYFAQTASLVNDFDIDLKNNLGPYSNIYLGINSHTGRLMSYQPLGPTLLYLVPYAATKPFVWVFSKIRGVAFDQYDPLFFVVLSFLTVVLFYFSGLLIRGALKFFFSDQVADITAIFTLWGTILPVYVFRRPIFGVIPEFFVVSLLIYLLTKYYKDGAMTLKRSILLGAVSGLLVIIRWNDVYLFPFIFMLYIYLAVKKQGFLRGLSYILVFLSLFVIFIILQSLVWINTYGHVKDFILYYCQLHAVYIYSRNTPFSYLKNLLHVLFGLDWGVIFTMPVLFLGGLSFISNSSIKVFKSRAMNILLFLLTFLACIHVVLQWKNTGEFYGYRFLVSLLPLSALGFAVLIDKVWVRYAMIITWLILLFCFFNFLVILPFELVDKTTMLPDTITPMGGAGWGNNAYFINAVQFYFTSDLKTLISVFSRGYLAASIFGILSLSGVDLARFGDKVKGYFVLSDYKSSVVFLYLLFVGTWFYFISRKKKILGAEK